MTEYKTAAAMAQHLASLIDDKNLITIAVRKRFPKYAPEYQVTRISHEDFDANGRRKPMSKFDSYMDSDLADRAYRAAVTIGSGRLAQAIHREHPAIMKALGAC